MRAIVALKDTESKREPYQSSSGQCGEGPAISAGEGKPPAVLKDLKELHRLLTPYDGLEHKRGQ